MEEGCRSHQKTADMSLSLKLAQLELPVETLADRIKRAKRTATAGEDSEPSSMPASAQRQSSTDRKPCLRDQDSVTQDVGRLLEALAGAEPKADVKAKLPPVPKEPVASASSQLQLATTKDRLPPSQDTKQPASRPDLKRPSDDDSANHLPPKKLPRDSQGRTKDDQQPASRKPSAVNGHDHGGPAAAGKPSLEQPDRGQAATSRPGPDAKDANADKLVHKVHKQQIQQRGSQTDAKDKADTKCKDNPTAAAPASAAAAPPVVKSEALSISGEKGFASPDVPGTSNPSWGAGDQGGEAGCATGGVGG